MPPLAPAWVGPFAAHLSGPVQGFVTALRTGIARFGNPATAAATRMTDIFFRPKISRARERGTFARHIGSNFETILFISAYFILFKNH